MLFIFLSIGYYGLSIGGFMVFVLALLFPVFGFAQTYSSATLYDLKSNRQKTLFTLNVDLAPQTDGLQTLTEFRDTEGKVVVSEKGLIKEADVLSYEIDRKQTGEKGRFQVRDGRIYFEYEGPGGKKKSADEKLSGFVLSTPNFNAFVEKSWDALSAGKPLDVRFAVWDRLETVGFTLQKVGEKDTATGKWMELRMKPTSFIIAAIVDPIHLWYSQADKKLQVMKGRVAPKIQKDGKWKDLDAEIVYTYDQKSVSK